MTQKSSSSNEAASGKERPKAQPFATTEDVQNQGAFSGGLFFHNGSGPRSAQAALIHHNSMRRTQKISLARRISHQQGNRHLTDLLDNARQTEILAGGPDATVTKFSKNLEDIGSRNGNDALQRQAGPLGPGPRPEYLEGGESGAGEKKGEKRYSITLTTGTRADLTALDAISVLREVVYKTNHDLEMAQGEHEVLKKTRDESPLVGVGGWLTDLFGEDMPPLTIWDKPNADTARASAAVAAGDVEGAASALIEAGASYDESKKQWLVYKNQLEAAGNLATAAVVVVAVVAIAVAVVATPAIAGGAAGGGTTAGGATAGGAAAGEATASGAAAVASTAAGATGTGTVVVGGGVGGAVATGATLPGIDLVLMLISRIGAMLASGNTTGATTVLTAYASTPSGRQTLLRCHQVLIAQMQQLVYTREEFQIIKQLSERFYIAARGG